MELTEAEILANAIELKELLGMEITEEDYAVSEPVEPKAKVKCKVCGFHKKPRKSLVETGVCKVCTAAISDGGEVVEVVGRMGKRGRNTVSVMVNGRRCKVKRLSSKHSERIAAKYVSKSKGYARKPKAHVTDIVSPKGLPTSSRLAGDDRI
jgi:hypothetical protein